VDVSTSTGHDFNFVAWPMALVENASLSITISQPLGFSIGMVVDNLPKPAKRIGSRA
jgi:hypothetical protein